jgi:hypothetical protein
MPFHITRVEKIIDYTICSYLVHAPKGLANGHGFINLNKLNKCFALVTLLPFSKKMNCYQGSHKAKRQYKQKHRRLSTSSHQINRTQDKPWQTIHSLVKQLNYCSLFGEMVYKTFINSIPYLIITGKIWENFFKFLKKLNIFLTRY